MRNNPVIIIGGVLVGGIVLAVVGGKLGQSRGFVLKVQAQTALCQAAIEENTRPRR
jgi:hypothetical protein